ncbi:MAG: protein-L-isoaspartate(D-aspartate) O-methyltransferase [Clostridia bacterium]|nr:protein-L-isoaspartate(D-aspartate) O-methyltransferase [Clostridia bacterium]
MADQKKELEEESSRDHRRRMVEDQLIARGIIDQKVLRGMQTVPRHLFIPDHLRIFAYEDRPLPIAEGQTISQPYIVAMMAQALELKSPARVLEIGTGSGYGAAILSFIADSVYTVERHQALADEAGKRLADLHYDNIKIKIGDGSKGWEEEAPFDGIVVTAAAPDIPRTLLAQLTSGGNLVIPVGERKWQELLRIRKNPDDSCTTENLGAVRFVPLLGKEGHPVPR